MAIGYALVAAALAVASATGSGGTSLGEAGSAPGSVHAPEPPVVGGSPSVHMGEVTYFNGNRGYGYITPLDGGSDVFFSQSDVHCRYGVPDLFVSYELKLRPIGPIARNITCPAQTDPDWWPY